MHLLILNEHGSHVTLQAIEQAYEVKLDMITFSMRHFPRFITFGCQLF
jgi:hypothetical protein